MNHDPDARLRQLAGEMAESAPAPLAWDEVEARATSPVGRAPRHLVLAAAAVFAVAIGAIVALALALAGRNEPDVVTSPSPVTNEPDRTATPTTPPGVESTTATAPPTAATDPPTTATTAEPRCPAAAEDLVAVIMDQRIAGDTSGRCVDVPELFGPERPEFYPCWSECADGTRVTGYELGAPATRWGDAATGPGGWMVEVVVDYRLPDGNVNVDTEYWELTEAANTTLRLTGIAASSTVDGSAIIALAVVGQYLDALADGRYGDAAAPLAGYAVDVSEQQDLAVLPGFPGFPDGLDVALRTWCEMDDRCRPPSSLTTRPHPDGFVEVIATYETDDGPPVTAVFSGSLYEGGPPSVNGIPPAAAG